MLSPNEPPQLTYDSVLISPDRVSDISSRFDDKQCNPYVEDTKLLPVVSAPMDSISCASFIEASKDRIFAIFSHRFQDPVQQRQHILAGAQAVIGLNTTRKTLDVYLEAGATHVLLDVANGGNVAVLKKLEELQYLRREGIYLWAGNVASSATYASLAPLCDYVRVGIGGGSACTTRVNTGVGVGNITAIHECVKRRLTLLNIRHVPYDAHPSSVSHRKVWEYLGWTYPPAKIVADGGIRNNGDICKALACGADLVMLGRMFAATHESAAPWRLPKQYEELDVEICEGYPIVRTPADQLNYMPTRKVYRGMASKEINEEHKPGDSKVSIEGAQGIINVTGSVSDLLNQIEGNLRSSMSYVNAHSLGEFKHKANVYPVAHSVTIENGAHMR